MFKYFLFYVTIIGLVHSYTKVISDDSNQQCTMIKKYSNFNKEPYLELCNLSQSHFEDKFMIEFMNVSKKQMYINDLFDVLMLKNYDLLGCYDDNKINFIKSEIDSKLENYLKSESFTFQYIYHFLKFINSIIGFLFLVSGLIVSILIFGANYFVFEAVNLILLTN